MPPSSGCVGEVTDCNRLTICAIAMAMAIAIAIAICLLRSNPPELGQHAAVASKSAGGRRVAAEGNGEQGLLVLRQLRVDRQGKSARTSSREYLVIATDTDRIFGCEPRDSATIRNIEAQNSAKRLPWRRSSVPPGSPCAGAWHPLASGGGMALLYLARVALQAWHWLVDLSGLLGEGKTLLRAQFLIR
eukprot:scaffold8357_cov296-Pinguiococcus_pyrenoidosus.AAC.3